MNFGRGQLASSEMGSKAGKEGALCSEIDSCRGSFVLLYVRLALIN